MKKILCCRPCMSSHTVSLYHIKSCINLLLGHKHHCCRHIVPNKLWGYLSCILLPCCSFIYFMKCFNVCSNFSFVCSGGKASSGGGAVSPLTPNNRQSTTSTSSPFPRNFSTRSTFHGGQTRRTPNNNPGYGGLGAPLTSQDTSVLPASATRTSFFSKISSKFSKR